MMETAAAKINRLVDKEEDKERTRGMTRALRSLGRELSRPSAIRKPAVYLDGNLWCALDGENIQIGVCGFGDTPDAACAAFDLSWLNEKPGPSPDDLQLMAASPDLLATLDAIVAAWDVPDYGDKESKVDRLFDPIEQARAAIAKAKP